MMFLRLGVSRRSYYDWSHAVVNYRVVGGCTPTMQGEEGGVKQSRELFFIFSAGNRVLPFWKGRNQVISTGT